LGIPNESPNFVGETRVKRLKVMEGRSEMPLLRVLREQKGVCLTVQDATGR